MSLARDIADLGAVTSRLDTVGASSGALSNRNILMNGAQVISQRGTSAITASSSADTFITDRYRISNYSDATFTGQQVADAPTDFEYSCKVTTTGTDTSLAAAQYQRFITAIEGYNMNHLNYGTSNAKTCTLTFHVKSSLTGAFYVFGFNSAANRSIVVGYTIDSADTWEKKSIQISGDQSGTWLTTNGAGMYFGWLLGSGTDRHTTTTDAFQAGFYMGKSDQVNLAGTNSATWQITGVQLEVGTATDFEHRSYGDELARCQRYTYVIGDSSNVISLGGGSMYTSTAINVSLPLPVQLRANPSATGVANGTGNWLSAYVGATGTASNPTPQVGDNTQAFVRVYCRSAHSGSSPAAAGAAVWCMVLAGAQLIIDAEL